MPEADSILVIWIKLLSQAGKTNASGYIYLNENIPYTEEMLSTLFNRPLGTVRLALQTFKDFGMIEIDDNHFISISNWEKHQNVEGMEKIREQTRKRVQRYREQKKIKSDECNVTRNVTVTDGNATDIELDRDIDNIPYVEIVDYLNEKTDSKFKSKARATREKIKARWNEGYRTDEFKQVIDYCSAEWSGKNFGEGRQGDDYLRPSTLFNGKFGERLELARKRQMKQTSPPSNIHYLDMNNPFGDF